MFLVGHNGLPVVYTFTWSLFLEVIVVDSNSFIKTVIDYEPINFLLSSFIVHNLYNVGEIASKKVRVSQARQFNVKGVVKEWQIDFDADT